MRVRSNIFTILLIISYQQEIHSYNHIACKFFYSIALHRNAYKTPVKLFYCLMEYQYMQ